MEKVVCVSKLNFVQGAGHLKMHLTLTLVFLVCLCCQSVVHARAIDKIQVKDEVPTSTRINSTKGPAVKKENEHEVVKKMGKDVAIDRPPNPQQQDHINGAKDLQGIKEQTINLKKEPLGAQVVKDDKIENVIIDDKEENVKEFDKDNDAEIAHETNLEKLLEKHHEDTFNLKLKDLNLDDHMDGVKLEKDGHINKDYKKEVLFGDAHGIDESHMEQTNVLIQDTFKKADYNNDGYLTQEELEKWIQKRVNDHLLEAKVKGAKIFRKLDTNGDGFLKWEEYLATYQKMKESEVHENHMDGGDNDDDESQPDRNEILRYKRNWDEADKESDGQLSLEEFVAFKHPENSPNTIDLMVRDILEQLDINKDNIITMKEFINLPDSGVDLEWVQTRKKEFINTLDENKDGNVTIDELKKYVDPQHPKHAREEAQNLVSMADDDHDGKLSLDEVLTNRDVFLFSKMINVDFSLHDEF